jgi:hypothetical protein
MIRIDHDHDGTLIGQSLLLTGGWRLRHECPSPLGVKGVITMKMMINTNNTSIIGVMLMSLFGPPPPPTDIPIEMLLIKISLVISNQAPHGSPLAYFPATAR